MHFIFGMQSCTSSVEQAFHSGDATREVAPLEHFILHVDTCAMLCFNTSYYFLRQY